MDVFSLKKEFMINAIIHVIVLCIWVPLSVTYPATIANLSLYGFMHPLIITSTIYPYWLSLQEIKMKILEQQRKELDAIELKDILAIPKGFHEFYNYLKSEFGCENLLFWARIERLKRFEDDPEATKEIVLSIYHEFIQPGSCYMITLPIELQRKIQEDICEVIEDRYPVDQYVDLYNDAQARIYHVMKKEAYVRFKRSENFTSITRKTQFLKTEVETKKGTGGLGGFWATTAPSHIQYSPLRSPMPAPDTSVSSLPPASEVSSLQSLSIELEGRAVV